MAPKIGLCMSNWFAVMCAISTRVQVKTFKLKSRRMEICTFNLECIRQFNNNKYLFGHLYEYSGRCGILVQRCPFRASLDIGGD